jgi:hypothetical protein
MAFTSVPGVRVRMEEPVQEDLLQVGMAKRFRERRALQLHEGERGKVGDLGTGDEIHREDAGGDGSSHEDGGSSREWCAQQDLNLRPSDS